MLDMKTATIRKVQHNLAEVLSWVERGEEVRVLRRKKVVARLVPPTPDAPPSPDFLTRAKAIWGAKPRGTPPSEIVSESRGDR
jgi:antitoxin (DNA-binding transcriptional repressor) of toxin-antitoxin stability system